MRGEEKKELIEVCQKMLATKLKNAQETLHGIRSADNSEQKSSAGDKHNTSQAMLHLEQEKNAKNYQEIEKQYRFFNSITFKSDYRKAEVGAVVKIPGFTFFIAVNLGKIKFENTDIFCISAASPMGQQLLGKSVRESVTFQNKTFTIQKIL